MCLPDRRSQSALERGEAVGHRHHDPASIPASVPGQQDSSRGRATGWGIIAPRQMVGVGCEPTSSLECEGDLCKHGVPEKNSRPCTRGRRTISRLQQRLRSSKQGRSSSYDCKTS
jgi:hypothetical protein